jgi:four helix bundle protein
VVIEEEERVNMTFEEWEATVPREIREDPLWKVEAYRLGLFLSDVVWTDAGKLLKEVRALSFADQICRAAGKLSSNVSEGYSRGSGKDRAKFYEYALGSARETRDWYYKSRHVLKEQVTTHRIGLCTQLNRLLIRMVANERRQNRRIIEKSLRV